MADYSVPTKLISDCFIRPVFESEESKQPYHLGPAEIAFLSFHFLQKGLLFAKPASFEIEPFLDKLKRALSIALVQFYPLAGRFVTVTCPDERSCWIYLDCNKGPGARFIHADCSAATVDNVVLSEPEVIPVIRSFFDLGEEGVIGVHGCTRALLSVQVTELIDGVFIGFTMSHSVADGSSFWNFANTLSEIFGSISINNHNNDQTNMKISHEPIYKPFFPDGYGPIIKLPYSNINELLARFPSVGLDLNLRERIFHFSSSSVAKLKAQANSECDGDICGQISSFQSVCAFLWRSITRARHLGPEEMTTITIVASSRTRIDPPLSMAHFGNMILPIEKSCKVGELLGNGLGWAAILLKRTIATLDDKAVRERSKMVIDLLLGRLPANPSWVGGHCAVVIGGSVRFNCYGPEFGMGKAIAVRNGYAAKTDGKVTASQGREGGGSMDLEVSLSPQVMATLERDQPFISFVSQNKY